MSTVSQVDVVDVTEMVCSITEHLQRWRVDDSVWYGSDLSVFCGCEQLAQEAGIWQIEHFKSVCFVWQTTWLL